MSLNVDINKEIEREMMSPAGPVGQGGLIRLLSSELKARDAKARNQLNAMMSPASDPNTIINQNERETENNVRQEITNKMQSMAVRENQKKARMNQALAGIAARGATNMNRMANGGIVGYAEGGLNTESDAPSSNPSFLQKVRQGVGQGMMDMGSNMQESDQIIRSKIPFIKRMLDKGPAITPQERAELKAEVEQNPGLIGMFGEQLERLGIYVKGMAGGGIVGFDGTNGSQVKDSSFPDLSGDGKITRKDILIGSGVIDKKEGGIIGYAGPEGSLVGGAGGDLNAGLAELARRGIDFTTALTQYPEDVIKRIGESLRDSETNLGDRPVRDAIAGGFNDFRQALRDSDTNLGDRPTRDGLARIAKDMLRGGGGENPRSGRISSTNPNPPALQSLMNQSQQRAQGIADKPLSVKEQLEQAERNAILRRTADARQLYDRNDTTPTTMPSPPRTSQMRGENPRSGRISSTNPNPPAPRSLMDQSQQRAQGIANKPLTATEQLLAAERDAILRRTADARQLYDRNDTTPTIMSPPSRTSQMGDAGPAVTMADVMRDPNNNARIDNMFKRAREVGPDVTMADVMRDPDNNARLDNMFSGVGDFLRNLDDKVIGADLAQLDETTLQTLGGLDDFLRGMDNEDLLENLGEALDQTKRFILPRTSEYYDVPEGELSPTLERVGATTADILGIPGRAYEGLKSLIVPAAEDFTRGFTGDGPTEEEEQVTEIIETGPTIQKETIDGATQLAADREEQQNEINRRKGEALTSTLDQSSRLAREVESSELAGVPSTEGGRRAASFLTTRGGENSSVDLANTVANDPSTENMSRFESEISRLMDRRESPVRALASFLTAFSQARGGSTGANLAIANTAMRAADDALDKQIIELEKLRRADQISERDFSLKKDQLDIERDYRKAMSEYYTNIPKVQKEIAELREEGRFTEAVMRLREVATSANSPYRAIFDTQAKEELGRSASAQQIRERSNELFEEQVEFFVNMVQGAGSNSVVANALAVIGE